MYPASLYYPFNAPGYGVGTVAFVNNASNPAGYQAKPSDYLVLLDLSAYGGAGPAIVLAEPIEDWPVQVRNVAGSGAAHNWSVAPPGALTLEDPANPGSFLASVNITSAFGGATWIFDRARARFVLYPPAGIGPAGPAGPAGPTGPAGPGAVTTQATNGTPVNFNDITTRQVVGTGVVVIGASAKAVVEVEIPYAVSNTSTSAVSWIIEVDGAPVETIVNDLPWDSFGARSIRQNFTWLGLLAVSAGNHTFSVLVNGNTGIGAPPNPAATSPAGTLARLLVTPQ